MPPVGIFRMANGSVACATSIDGAGSVQFGGMEGGLDNRAWGADFNVSATPANQASPNIAVTQGADYVEITATDSPVNGTCATVFRLMNDS